jgi:hypothetical protein
VVHQEGQRLLPHPRSGLGIEHHQIHYVQLLF